MPRIEIRLHQIMRERNLTGKELAKRSGVSESVISTFKYRTTVNLVHTAKIMKALNIDNIDELLRYVPDKNT